MKSVNDIMSLLRLLKKEKIYTWFDLGLFLDRLKESNELKESGEKENFKEFTSRIKQGGLAFITFHYMVDGVTVEASKYARFFEEYLPGMPIHFIGGSFQPKTETLIKKRFKKKLIPELAGFDDWKLYADFFLTRMERGEPAYNRVIEDLWSQTLSIIEKTGTYILQNNINLLYILNICSNPGNVSAALAMVLLSEYLGIQVINNNHDFYFEGGNSQYERKTKKLKKGPRDFFYTNAHLGEVFSIIEQIYPWESKLWLNVNINKNQSDRLIRQKGHNPARVLEIGTAVDTSKFINNDKRRNINALLQFEQILSRNGKELFSHAVKDVLERRLVTEDSPMPILIGNETRRMNKYGAENIIFLQPTRIIKRKRIEQGFELLKKIIYNEEMQTRFLATKNLKITLLVSGPIATGHYDYYLKLLKNFHHFLENIPEEFRNRVFLAFIFGEMERVVFKGKPGKPIVIEDLYNIASLILLPSKTEGRGLPIIEAAACGTPIFCRRYEPEEVYSEVIGEHLGEKDRLKVCEFRGRKIYRKTVEGIVDRVFFPHKYMDETKHNRSIVERRFSMKALNQNLEGVLKILNEQNQPQGEERKVARETLHEYENIISFKSPDLDFLLPQENRHYLPGYGRLSFMLMIKSIIDPSFFRSEQQMVRGSVFYFAKEILKNETDNNNIPGVRTRKFYNTVHQAFCCTGGEEKIIHDHSMGYRHRNRIRYLYQQFTFQEFTGIVNLLYLKIIQPKPTTKTYPSPQFFTDWNLALFQLTTSKYLAIDNRNVLIEKLKTNLPVAYFPGEYIMYELEFFALQAIRSRLKLPLEQELTEDTVERNYKKIAPVYIFAQDKKLGKQLNKEEITIFIKKGKSRELRVLLEYGLIRIISTNQLCVGIHFPQLGAEALSALRNIRKKGGFLLTNRRHAALMTDIVNIDRFHIGKIHGEFAANIMGIPVESGYIQYVPAGIRTTLAYPAPIQTARDFDAAIKGEIYRQLSEKMGEKTLMKKICQDAIKNGSPIEQCLEELVQEQNNYSQVRYGYLCGKFSDGHPYNGVIARINLEEKNWKFTALSTQGDPRTVAAIAMEFEKKEKKNPKIAWNGGYILNEELVGKLGLPKSYVGSPLGMIISQGRLEAPPLFNKAALLFFKNGTAEIRRVNCGKGIHISCEEWSLTLSEENYNTDDLENKTVYYDLLYKGKIINGNGRTIVRITGRTIKEVIKTDPGEKIRFIPTGLTLSFPANKIPGKIYPGLDLTIEIPGLEDVRDAIEAGPLILKDGEFRIDMENEGWISDHSISTQASRRDDPDMRGPKIAVGMNRKGELAVLAVNGRIRESVGATHQEMAEILSRHGMLNALEFDPGGSSTLFVEGKNLNITPYNPSYEYNIYALPPEPRAVSSAIIGYIEEDEI